MGKLAVVRLEATLRNSAMMSLLGAGPEDFLKVFPGHIPTAKPGDCLNNEATTLPSKAR